MSGTLEALNGEADTVQSQNLTPQTLGSAALKDGGNDGSAWIRYCLRVIDEEDASIISERVGKSFEDLKTISTTKARAVEPIFDVVETIKTRKSNSKNIDDDPGRLVGFASSRSLKIYSVPILNALRSVVRYYPSQSLTGNNVVVNHPYPILCHHYDELSEFRRQCLSRSPKDLCDREQDATTHIELLLDWLDTHIMSGVREEMERNKRGAYTWAWSWVRLRPGSTVISRTLGDRTPRAHVIESVRDGPLEQNSALMLVDVWWLEWDGSLFSRVSRTINTGAFEGERESKDELHSGPQALGRRLRVLTPKELENPEALEESIQSLVRRGASYWQTTSKLIRWYRGEGADAPHNMINALVMMDMGAYYTENPGERPATMGSDDLREYHSDCRCSVCLKTPRPKTVSPFADYWAFGLSTTPTWHFKLLFPPTVPGFVFRTRTWEKLSPENLEEPIFDTGLFANLVMAEAQKKRLLALVTSYARMEKDGTSITQPAWSADFVKGKGQGLIFLLHGSPGVGKTCTAECVSELLQRPLMVLTSSDIGTDPVEVEKNLTREFKKAKSWNAILLIDEADVFMEQRSTRDLTRNSLVAGFLRALEFYDGILFLTTNRVGTFDDAFISRIHVKLYYKDFTPAQRLQIWELFIAKLRKERGKSMHVTAAARQYLKTPAVMNLEWNGREIRNSFQTAVSLAEYDAERDDDGKVLITDEHFMAVVELSKDFDDYLVQLHKKGPAGRAQIRHERAEIIDEQR